VIKKLETVETDVKRVAPRTPGDGTRRRKKRVIR
jgi:hypothetical protein